MNAKPGTLAARFTLPGESLEDGSWISVPEMCCCNTCGALVSMARRELHHEWHDAFDTTR